MKFLVRHRVDIWTQTSQKMYFLALFKSHIHITRTTTSRHFSLISRIFSEYRTPVSTTCISLPHFYSFVAKMRCRWKSGSCWFPSIYQQHPENDPKFKRRNTYIDQWSLAANKLLNSRRNWINARVGVRVVSWHFPRILPLALRDEKLLRSLIHSLQKISYIESC